jgi:uncharacterized protein
MQVQVSSVFKTILSRSVTRRRVIGATVLTGASLAGSGAYGVYVEAGGEGQVKHYSLTPPGWTSGFKLKVAALSDMHCGGFHMPLARIQEIVAKTNALGADVILLLGDYVTRTDRNIHQVAHDVWAAELAKLRAPLGVHAILGNHEYWDDVRTHRDRTIATAGGEALKSVGIPVLSNRAIRLVKDGQPFWLAGLDDQIAYRLGPRQFLGRDDLVGTLAQVTDQAPIILMAHEPDIFVNVPARVSLTLSGHTHAGQIRILGWSPYIPSQYGNRFAYGHIVEENRNLIVTAGLGTSGPPLRLGAPPEIVLIDLV